MSAWRNKTTEGAKRIVFGGVKSMWLMVAFDLPTETKSQRSAYRKFREFLISDGFMMLQYSVYARSCPNIENAELHGDRVANKMPDEGQVRCLHLTSLQFARMKCFYGKKDVEPESEPDQLTFF
jgi:CRISPR-associated protein Cas2